MIEEITWESSIEDFHQLYGEEDELIESEEGTVLYYSALPINFSVDHVEALICFAGEENQLVSVMIGLDLETPIDSFLHKGKESLAIDKYKEVSEEIRRLYDGRSRLIFSDVKEMENIYYNKNENENETPLFRTVLAASRGFVETFLEAKGDNEISDLADCSGLMVEEKNLVITLFSNENKKGDEAGIIFINGGRFMEAIPNHLETLSNNTSSYGRFGLPEGIEWKDSQEQVDQVLNNQLVSSSEGESYVSYDREDSIEGFEVSGLFGFDEDQLQYVFYDVNTEQKEEYESVLSILKDDYGYPLSEDGIEDMNQAQMLLGENIENSAVWILADTVMFCAFASNEKTTYIFMIDKDMLQNADIFTNVE